MAIKISEMDPNPAPALTDKYEIATAANQTYYNTMQDAFDTGISANIVQPYNAKLVGIAAIPNLSEGIVIKDGPSSFTTESTLSITNGGTGAATPSLALANLGGASLGLIDTLNGIVGLAGYNINFQNSTGTHTSFLTNSATAPRAWEFPDVSGTVPIPLTGSFNISVTGAFSATVSVNYLVVGGICTLTFPFTSDTASASLPLNFSLPAGFFPLAPENHCFQVANNGTTSPEPGLMSIQTDGSASVYSNMASANFGTSDVGFFGRSVTYRLA